MALLMLDDYDSDIRKNEMTKCKRSCARRGWHFLMKLILLEELTTKYTLLLENVAKKEKNDVWDFLMFSMSLRT